MRRTTLVCLGAALAAAGLAGACGSKSTLTTTASGAGGHASTSASTGTGTTGAGGNGGSVPEAGDSVLTHHKHLTRDGVYVEPALTKAALAGLHQDPSFQAQTQGKTYAQPLFVDGLGKDKDLLFVATEQNQVYALDAATGAVVWSKQVGTPVPLGDMPCGNIDPLGITGTPVIDLPSRTIFFDALTSPDNFATKKHLIFALSIDDGSVKAGWPVDMSTVTGNGHDFESQYHGERGALAVVGGTLYVPFGGLYGDCGDYHGWIVAVPLDNPAGVTAWATGAQSGGAWGPGGVASDGTNVFIATGNTTGTSAWNGGEAVLRFGVGAPMGGTPASYWAPTNWKSLDAGDVDLGGSGVLLVDLPGSSPSQLAVALGKDGNAYLLDRGHLAGVSDAVATLGAASDRIVNSPATYTTAAGTYVAFKGTGTQCTAGSGDLTTIQIKSGTPPTLAPSWCATQGGKGSPMVTMSDAAGTDAVVWGLGAEMDAKLHGFDGDTGAAIVSVGGPPGLVRFTTAIAAKGRIFVAGDSTVYAFTP